MSRTSAIATFNPMAADSDLSQQYGTHTIVQVVAGLAAALAIADSTPEASALTVRWSDGVATGASPLISDGSPKRTLGFASSVWRSGRGGRELVAATIEVEATASWPAGMSELDGLAIVFVHELGHVIGLGHSPEASSFMYERMSRERRYWTSGDLEGLEAGRQLGCAVSHTNA